MEQNNGPFGCVCKGDTLLAGIIGLIYVNMGSFFWVASFDSGEDVKVCVSFPSDQLKKVLCQATFYWIYLYPMSRFFYPNIFKAQFAHKFPPKKVQGSVVE